MVAALVWTMECGHCEGSMEGVLIKLMDGGIKSIVEKLVLIYLIIDTF